jgi:CRISPR/Cas system-associated exonuclease Cas4 (RecB family)
MLAIWILRVRSRHGDEKWLPRELRNAELVYAETLFRSGGDVPITAKCDRAYRTRKGVIVLVELKTRGTDKTYASDVIELSAQRFAIQAQNGESVAEYGYVLVLGSNRRKLNLHRVQLLSNTDVIALAKRREEILCGNAIPEPACSKKMCSNCSFKRNCTFGAQR